jgi:hypothetical protein
VGCSTDERAVSRTLTGVQQGNGSGRAYVCVAAGVINIIKLRRQRDYIEFCGEKDKFEIYMYTLKCIDILFK